MKCHAAIDRVTDRIRERRTANRADYLRRLEPWRRPKPARGDLSCGNLAHGFGSCPQGDTQHLADAHAVNVAIVVAM